MRDKAVTILKVLVSLVLVAWAFSKVNMTLVRAELASANLWFILVAFLLFLLAIVINGAKWQILLRAQDMAVPFGAVVEFQFIGFFFNNILPANIGGDLMRGYNLARYTDRTADAAVSVIVDRIIGLMAYMSSAVVAALVVVRLADRPEWRSLEWVALAVLLGLSMALAVMMSRRLRAQITRLFGFRWFAPLAPMWAHISAAFDAYRFRYGALAAAFAVGLAGIVCTALVNWCLSLSMGGLMSLSLIFLMNPLIALVLMLPISIGGLGVTQTVYPFFFSLGGVPAGHALAVSILMQLVIFLGGLPGAFLWLRSRSGRQAARAEESVTGEVPYAAAQVEGHPTDNLESQG